MVKTLYTAIPGAFLRQNYEYGDSNLTDVYSRIYDL